MGLEEEIDALEEEIKSTPYNKATESHIGRLKSKLADKKEKLEQQGGSGGGSGYAVEKTGDASIALVGFPSVGKSTLINALTNAESTVGAYEFTTLDVNPGMLAYRGANLQILDVPGLISGAAGGRGGGREVLSVVRTADLVVFVLSVFKIEQYARLREELYANKIRLDVEPPRVTVNRTHKGGINLMTDGKTPLADETIEEVLREQGVVNADVTIRGPVDIDRLIDGIMRNRVYIPSVIAINKADLVDASYGPTVTAELEAVGIDPDDPVYISAETGQGLDALKDRIWERLGFIRVYMDKPGRGVDREEPLVLREQSATVGDAIETLGGVLAEKFRFARVSGPSAKHADQQVGTEHTLADGDVLRIVTSR